MAVMDHHMAERITRMQSSQECVMVFAKAPVIGRVKTRLAADIGDKAATELYRAFVKDLLGMLDGTDYPIHIHFTPYASGREIRDWLGGADVLIPQADGDLGQRMASAFTYAFSNYIRRTVLIGTDFPDLPASFIHQAFDALLTHDAVLGPSHDGGYYLIGFNRHGFVPEVFQDMSWSTDQVFSKTVRIFERHHATVQYLDPWWDIDTHADLMGFIRRRRYAAGDAAPETKKLIHDLGLMPIES